MRADRDAGRSPWVVGLTGGIGSGKSTVADLFAAYGIEQIDTDRIAHALTGIGGLAMPAIRAQFGEAFLTAEGAMDRAAMRRAAFADPQVRKRLQDILHPLIRAECLQAVRHAHSPYVLLVVPLLIESGHWRDHCNRVLVVDCDEMLQIERVVRRSGLAPEEVARILAVQTSRAARLAAADDVIDNSDGASALHPQVERLHRDYLRLSTTGKPHDA